MNLFCFEVTQIRRFYYNSQNISKYQQSEIKLNYEIFAYQLLNATLKLDAPGYLATHKPRWPISVSMPLAKGIDTV